MGGGSTGPLNLPLYYVRDLMCMCIVSPIIFFVVKNLRGYGVFFLLLLFVFGKIPSCAGFRSTGVMFFTLGAYFSINGKEMVCYMKKWGVLCTVILLILILNIIGVVDWGKMNLYCRNICPFVGLCSLMWILSIRGLSPPLKKWHAFYTESIFFLYVAHEGLPILSTSILLSHLLIPSTTYTAMFIQYIVSVFFCILIGEILFFILKSFFPSVCDVLNGKYRYKASKQLKG